GAGGDQWMRPESTLDLSRRDVLSARDEDLLEPIDDVMDAVGIPAQQVAGAQPITVHGALGGLGVVEVAGEHARTAHPQLPGCGALEFATGERVDYPGVDARIGSSDRSRMRRDEFRREVEHVG